MKWGQGDRSHAEILSRCDLIGVSSMGLKFKPGEI